MPSRLTRSFHIAVKPIGSRCNIDCTYCYYLHKQGLLADSTASPISDELLEEFIRQYVTGQEAESIEFTWHGGEPTLLGLDFYRKIVELQKKYASGKRIDNDLQTNGLLLNDAWCEFLKAEKFLVGLSIDGPKRLHDRFRVTRNGQPTFDHVYGAARLLQRHNVPLNALTVVNSANARYPEDVYRFLTDDLECRYIQWLPCVEPKDFRTVAPGHWNPTAMPMIGSTAARPGSPDSVVTDWSVDPDDFGEFLCGTFDLWYKNDIGRVFVNWFESLVGQWMHKPPQLCTMAEVCGRCLAIEKDGSVYSCDHFVFPEYRLGNAATDDLAALMDSPAQRAFGEAKASSLPTQCRRCEYLSVCHGECPKNRFVKSVDGEAGLNYLCAGYLKYFRHITPSMNRMARALADGRAVQ